MKFLPKSLIKRPTKCPFCALYLRATFATKNNTFFEIRCPNHSSHENIGQIWGHGICYLETNSLIVDVINIRIESHQLHIDILNSRTTLFGPLGFKPLTFEKIIQVPLTIKEIENKIKTILTFS